MNATMLEDVSANGTSGESSLELSKNDKAVAGVYTATASGSVARPSVEL
jgi:hypothetical protein